MTADLTRQNRRLADSASAWVRHFTCDRINCLIICRGPVRREVINVLTEMGAQCGILLSEKDSITYQNALAPELRLIKDPDRIHRVPDYTGASREERNQRIQQIIKIAKDNNYNAIFAGYGFMSEDVNLVKAIEESELTFIGPCSRTLRQAGSKDEAKRTALLADVTIVPGIDDLTIRTLLAKAKHTEGGLESIANEHNLVTATSNSDKQQAETLLSESYSALIDLITIDEIATQAEKEITELFVQQPNNRIRLKAVGGGGGKGQRILKAPHDYHGALDEKIKQAASKVPALLREILNEVKATGRGDNKNIIIELNIENTRHQEIQVIGNGDWCLTLGGRDCSLQMHEQKLLEVSTTIESLKKAIASADQINRLEALKLDLLILERMEAEAKRFGEAVGLDSVSTFECIVDADQHFFMEMNTRIQVEHRVSELCYGLKFENPDNASDHFIINSMVEAMTIIAWHKKKLPEPKRVPRENTAVEARLNATNFALAPHAGGIIEYWSSPADGEIRDDQGICIKNPDTGGFMKYALPGAYDSNIALLLTVGSDRTVSYTKMAEILRTMVIDGQDVQTNLEFHYGLVNWFLAHDPYAKSTTAFIQPYLALAGLLYIEVQQLDLETAFQVLANRAGAHEVFDRKKTLIIRPLKRLLSNPHLLIGWISRTRAQWSLNKTRLRWNTNPFRVLADLYHYLNMDASYRAPAQEVIWDHDQLILSQGLDFYNHLDMLNEGTAWSEWSSLLAEKTAPQFISKDMWKEVQAAHRGFQMGLELLGLIVKTTTIVGFDDLRVNTDLCVIIPELLKDREVAEQARKILAPTPVASGNEIIAVSGGMFYTQETPGAPHFLEVGTHFNIGDPLYVIEVMKMFNKVYAEFSGTVTEVLIDSGDGVVVKKGESLYRIEPDETIKVLDEVAITATRHEHTLAQLNKL